MSQADRGGTVAGARVRARILRAARWFVDPGGLFAHTAVYLAISLVFLRVYLLSAGTIGHNWDWTIPPGTSYMGSGAAASFSTWSDHDLGFPRFIGQSPPYTAILLLGALGIPGDVLTKLVLWLSPVASAVSANWYLRVHAKRLNRGTGPLAHLLGGLFYGFSGVEFYWLLGGAPSGLLGNALLPAVLGSWEVRTWSKDRGESSRLPFMAFSALLASLTLISLPHFASAVGALVLMILLERTGWWREIKTLAKALLLSLPGLLSALLPTAFYYLAAPVERANGLSPYAPTVNLSYAPNGPLAFVFAGFYGRDMYFRSVPAPFAILFLLGSFGLFGWTVWRSVHPQTSDPREKRTAWVLAFTYLLFTGLSAGTNIFGPLMYALYALPLLAILRSTIYYESVAATAFTGLLPGQLRPSCGHRRLVLLLTIVLLLAYLLPWYTGDLGLSQRNTDADGTLDQYVNAPDYQAALSTLDSDPGVFNILVLPMDFAPYFLPTVDQRTSSPGNGPGYVGGEPSLLASAHGVLTYNPSLPLMPSSEAILRDLVSGIYGGTLPATSFARVMSFFDVKYVLLFKDRNDPWTSPPWNLTVVAEYLSTLPDYNRVVDGPSVTMYEVRAQDFGPRVYVAHRVAPLSVPSFATLVGDNGTTFWTAAGQGISLSMDFGDFLEGNSSLVVQLANSSGSEIRHVFSPALNFTGFDFVSSALKSSVGAYSVHLKFQSGTAGFFSFNYALSGSGWGWLTQDLSNFTTTGRPSWSNITLVDIAFPAGGNATLHINDLRLGRRLLSVLRDTGVSASRGDAILSPVDAIENVIPVCNSKVQQLSRFSNTDYHLQVQSPCPFLLVLEESFHSLWDLRAWNENGTPVSALHLIANGFGNGWFVNATGNLSIVISFAQEPVKNLGFAVGFGALGFEWAVCMVLYVRRRKSGPPRPTPAWPLRLNDEKTDAGAETVNLSGAGWTWHVPWMRPRISAIGLSSVVVAAGLLVTGFSALLVVAEPGFASPLFLVGYYLIISGCVAIYVIDMMTRKR